MLTSSLCKTWLNLQQFQKNPTHDQIGYKLLMQRFSGQLKLDN